MLHHAKNDFKLLTAENLLQRRKSSAQAIALRLEQGAKQKLTSRRHVGDLLPTSKFLRDSSQLLRQFASDRHDRRIGSLPDSVKQELDPQDNDSPILKLARLLTSFRVASGANDLDACVELLQKCTKTKANKAIKSDEELVGTIRDVITTALRGPAFGAILVQFTKAGVAHSTVYDQVTQMSNFLQSLAATTPEVVQRAFGKEADDLSARFASAIKLLRLQLSQHVGLRKKSDALVACDGDELAHRVLKGTAGPIVDELIRQIGLHLEPYVMAPLRKFEAGQYTSKSKKALAQLQETRELMYGFALLYSAIWITPFRTQSMGLLPLDPFWHAIQDQTWCATTNVDKLRASGKNSLTVVFATKEQRWWIHTWCTRVRRMTTGLKPTQGGLLFPPIKDSPKLHPALVRKFVCKVTGGKIKNFHLTALRGWISTETGAVAHQPGSEGFVQAAIHQCNHSPAMHLARYDMFDSFKQAQTFALNAAAAFSLNDKHATTAMMNDETTAKGALDELDYYTPALAAAAAAASAGASTSRKSGFPKGQKRVGERGHLVEAQPHSEPVAALPPAVPLVLSSPPLLERTVPDAPVAPPRKKRGWPKGQKRSGARGVMLVSNTKPPQNQQKRGWPKGVKRQGPRGAKASVAEEFPKVASNASDQVQKKRGWPKGQQREGVRGSKKQRTD